MTRNYPPPEGQAKDHPHQKSAWFCHGDVIPEGIELKDKIKGVAGVDFWSEAPGHGKIVVTQLYANSWPALPKRAQVIEIVERLAAADMASQIAWS